mgnify:FL=1
MHASDSAAMPDTVRAPTNQSGSKLRIVFMGSPEFAIPCLDRLAKTHEVCAVYSQPAKKSGRGMKTTPLPTADYALKAGLPLFTPDNLKSAKIEAQLARHQADLFVVVAYGLLLPAAILAIPRFGCLNGHASLLPRWRGAAPIQRAIEAGDTKTGISAMLMEEGLDTGPLVGVSRIEISNTETTGSLHDRLAILAASCLCEIIDNAPRSLESPVPQSENGVIYAPKITPADAMINWTRSATNLDYHIRAFSPYPGAWCNGPKGRLRILRARPISLARTTPNIAPSPIAGRFLCRHDDGAMIIGCGDDALAIDRLQPAGKSAMAASDFLNGAGLVVGDLLDSTNQ